VLGSFPTCGDATALRMAPSGLKALAEEEEEVHFSSGTSALAGRSGGRGFCQALG